MAKETKPHDWMAENTIGDVQSALQSQTIQTAIEGNVSIADKAKQVLDGYPIAARIFCSVNQVVANAVWNIHRFNTISYNYGGFAIATDVAFAPTNYWGIGVPSSGLYRLHGQALQIPQAGFAQNMQVQFSLNSNTPAAGLNFVDGSTAGFILSNGVLGNFTGGCMSTIVPLKQGDIIGFQWLQGGGASQSQGGWSILEVCKVAGYGIVN